MIAPYAFRRVSRPDAAQHRLLHTLRLSFPDGLGSMPNVVETRPPHPRKIRLLMPRGVASCVTLAS